MNDSHQVHIQIGGMMRNSPTKLHAGRNCPWAWRVPCIVKSRCVYVNIFFLDGLHIIEIWCLFIFSPATSCGRKTKSKEGISNEEKPTRRPTPAGLGSQSRWSNQPHEGLGHPARRHRNSSWHRQKPRQRNARPWGKRSDPRAQHLRTR